jgi:uncharacterized protein YbaR (Trm112 family)
MFIELAEYLKCPAPHEETYLVLATGAMKGRDIRFGMIGCPVCKAEYPIVDDVAKFGEPPPWTPPRALLPSVEVVHALLAIGSPGGYLTLLGSAALLAADLAGVLAGVHMVCVNAPPAVAAAATRSLLEASRSVPLRTAVARGVVVGGECLAPEWLGEAGRVLLRGQRLVALAEDVPAPAGITPAAAGQGLWVGTKR